jgi:hypothetical protein
MMDPKVNGQIPKSTISHRDSGDRMMDPKVNGQMQDGWGWLVAVYLFLGGVGGGAYTIAAINGFLGEGAALSTRIGLWIGFPALLVGSLFLVVDLGSPTRAVLAGMKPKTSWMARGFWIISIFMVLAFLHLVLHLMGRTEGLLIDIIAGAGIVFAVSTVAYTGILLGASKGIPFWRTGIVPVVFVVSALVTGHFTIMLGMTLFGEAETIGSSLRTMAIEAAVLGSKGIGRAHPAHAVVRGWLLRSGSGSAVGLDAPGVSGGRRQGDCDQYAGSGDRSGAGSGWRVDLASGGTGVRCFTDAQYRRLRVPPHSATEGAKAEHGNAAAALTKARLHAFVGRR